MGDLVGVAGAGAKLHVPAQVGVFAALVLATVVHLDGEVFQALEVLVPAVDKLVRVGPVLLVDGATEASGLAEVVGTAPVLVVLVHDNELTVSLGDGFIDAACTNTDVEVFVVEVDLGSEGHFIFVVFLGGELKFRG